jgi:hypothetical protein
MTREVLLQPLSAYEPYDNLANKQYNGLKHPVLICESVKAVNTVNKAQ